MTRKGRILKIDRRMTELRMADQLMSVTELSKASHVSVPTIRKAFRGSDVSPRVVGLLARAMGVDAVEIAAV